MRTTKAFHPAIGILAILLAALTLRIIFTGISPHQQALQQDLNASFSQFGLLAALPQFCAGAFSFLLPFMLRRATAEQVALAGLLFMSTLLFIPLAASSLSLIYLLVIIGGAGIALTQPALQAVIKHHYPNTTMQMVSLTILGMHMGSGLTAVMSPPLASWLGDWEWALFFFGVIIALCAVVWALTFASDMHPASSKADHSASSIKLLNNPLTWLIITYFASSGIVYISLLSWLPGYFLERGASQQSAANMLGLFLFCQALPALALAIVARDHWSKRSLLTAGGVLTGVGILIAFLDWKVGIVLFPILAGLGLGLSFPVAMSLPHYYGDSPHETARLTMYGLGIGSIACAPFPFVIGWLKDLQSPVDPLIAIILLSTLIMLAIIPALKPRAANPE